jgi:hypothetical protein
MGDSWGSWAAAGPERRGEACVSWWAADGWGAAGGGQTGGGGGRKEEVEEGGRGKRLDARGRRCGTALGEGCVCAAVGVDGVQWEEGRGGQRGGRRALLGWLMAAGFTARWAGGGRFAVLAASRPGWGTVTVEEVVCARSCETPRVGNGKRFGVAAAQEWRRTVGARAKPELLAHPAVVALVGQQSAHAIASAIHGPADWFPSRPECRER